MFFFFKGKKKKHRNRNRDARSSYKTKKKSGMGYVQSIMLSEAIINKKRLFVYAE